MKTLALLIGLMAMPLPAYGAEPLSARVLAVMCDVSEATTTVSFCTGYVQGVSEALKLWQPALFCVSPSVSVFSISQVVKDYMNLHPDVLRQKAQDVVFFALSDAFPCPN